MVHPRIRRKQPVSQTTRSGKIRSHDAKVRVYAGQPKIQEGVPEYGTELIRWDFVDRHTRKGYLTRDFFIGRRRYRWTSNGMSRDGIIRYGILVRDHEVQA